MRAPLDVVLALASCLALAPAGAAAQGSTCLTSTPAGTIAVARAHGGTELSVRAPFEAQFHGARVDVVLTELGLRASADVGDVDIVLAATVEVSPGVYAVRGASAFARSVGPRTAIVALRGMEVELPRARVPRDALALGGAIGAPGCALSDIEPAGWAALEAERARGERVMVAGTGPLLLTLGGTPVAARVTGGSAVRLEARGGWSRVVIGEAGVSVVGWVRSDRIGSPPRYSGGGGGGYGDGRIVLGCLRGEPGLSAATLDVRTPFLATPGGRALAELPAGTTLVLGARRGDHVAVVEALGVRRIPRDCERGEPSGLGWIAIGALTSQ